MISGMDRRRRNPFGLDRFAAFEYKGYKVFLTPSGQWRVRASDGTNMGSFSTSHEAKRACHDFAAGRWPGSSG